MNEPQRSHPESQRELLRRLPQIEKLLQLPNVRQLTEVPHLELVRTLRRVVERLRDEILRGKLDGNTLDRELAPARIAERTHHELRLRAASAYGRAINATGVILHTGLGRAVLPQPAVDAVSNALRGYSVVEIDPVSGDRNHREHAVAAMLVELTGAEAAVVVNNNAAAVLLILAALAREREVIVSRGELVEIGGSFRVPEIMAESGSRLVEVGATNRTYTRDYEGAINAATALLLQVHTSNYAIRGFAHQPPLQELVNLGRRHEIPIACDLGSGCFVELSSYGFEPEPLASDAITAGADLVSFSGDKLLGSCQAGIIVGKRALVARLRAHALFRPLRVDKTTLVLLEETLRAYRDPSSLCETIPTLRMIATPLADVEKRAQRYAAGMRDRCRELEIEVVKSAAQAGSGALPDQEIPSYAVRLQHQQISAEELARRLRVHSPPVFARCKSDAVFLDCRTILPQDEHDIVIAVTRCAAV